MKSIPRLLYLLVAAVALTAMGPVGVRAQVVSRAELTTADASDAEARYNAAATIRVEGDFAIPTGTQLRGDLAVLGGSVRVDGELDGRLLVINGDLVVGGGGRITGTVTVIGGNAVIQPGATATAGAVVYPEPLRYRKRGADLVVETGEGGVVSPRFFDSSVGSARGHITIRAGTNYNRVEGLPVLFGPVIRTGGTNPLTLEALAIWRTNEGFSLADGKLGYRIRLEKALGGGGDYALGGTWHSEVQPIDEQGLTDVEASLATFFLHRDYRDYFDREGWSVYGRANGPFSPVVVRAEYRDERHGYSPVGGPWSLTDNDGAWRAQPLVGAGDLQSLTADLTYDSRNSEKSPTSGLMAQLGVTSGLGGGIALPSHSSGPGFGGAPEFAPSPLDDQFSKGWAEVEWYSRVGPRSILAARLYAGGSLDGRRLPPQFQTALGGEGSLPGYNLFEFDCGARSQTVYIDHPDPDTDEDVVVPAFLGYGCDRSVLIQAEYRSEFGGSVPVLGDGRFDGTDWLPPIDLTPGWTVFADFGRGWALGDESVGLLESRGTRARADLGAGILLGGLGAYWALPLSGDDRQVNFFLRFAHRF